MARLLTSTTPKSIIMKKNTFTLFLILLGFAPLFAQNTYDLVFFTEETEPFTVSINGVQQHAQPETNVRVNGFIQPILKLNVDFNNPNIPSISKNLYMPEGSAEVTYQVKKTKRGYKVRGYSMVPLAQLPPRRDVVGQQTVIYTTTPVVTQTTTTTTTSGGNNDNINVNMNVGGVDMGISVDVNMGDEEVVYQETTTTTTTTTAGSHYIMEGYDGSIGCPWPMTYQDFEEARATILSKTFDDTRLSLAKQIIQSNCMFSDQIKDLVAAMEFEDTKLELAKFAYGYTYDIGNYFKVSQALEFEFSVDELNEYIANFRW